MKQLRALALFLVLALCLSFSVACLPTDTAAGGGSTTTTTGGGTGGGGKPDTIDGVYYVTYYMGAMTFTINGNVITSVNEDHYYNNTSRHVGELTLDDTDDDETTVKYRVVWEEGDDGGTLVFRTIYYNPVDKTLTTSSSFATYVLEKQS